MIWARSWASAILPEPLEHRAVLWQEGVLTNLGTLGGIGHTYAYDISDAGSIVGSYCYDYSGGNDCHPQAFLYRNGEPSDIDPGGAEVDDTSVAFSVNIHDEVLGDRGSYGPFLWREGVLQNLDELVEMPPELVLGEATQINDRGDVLCNAYDRNVYVNRPVLLSRGGIVHPSTGGLMVSGTDDPIRWNVPEDMGFLYIELNTHVRDEPDRYVPVGNAQPLVGQFFWTVPDSVSTQCRIRLFSPGYPDTIYSGIFRMKPLMLTRLDERGDYVPWTMTRDNWSQRNIGAMWWPETWWVGNPDFDYEDGVDPISEREYPSFPRPSAAAFDTAEESIFPDWPLFVKTFGEAQCYENVAEGTYNPTALWNWFCTREEFIGTCSGLAYSSLMNFLDPEGMRNRFPELEAHETLPDNQPADDDIRLIPNQLHWVQIGADQLALQRERKGTMTPRDVVRILEEEFAKDEPLFLGPLGMYNLEEGGGHAMLPFKLTADHSGADSTWNILTYDPNGGDELTDVRIRKQPGQTDASWRAIVNDRIWRETGTGLTVDEPADLDYGESVQLLPLFDNGGGGGTFAARSEPFVVSQDFTVFTSALGSMELTASDRPGTAGHVDGHPVNGLSGVTPLYRKTGVIGPPNGYLISGESPSATYTFEMGDAADAERRLGVFRGDASVCYLRAPGDSSATDRVSFGRGGTEIGVAAAGTPGAPKTITLTTIAQEVDHKKVWMVSEIQLADGDSIRVDRVGTEDVRILNAGPSPRTCTIGLERASQFGDPQFLAAGIDVPAGSSLRVVPDWSDLAEAPVSIQVDLGNDGSVDDVIEVENELGEAPSDAPESLQAAAFGFHAHPLADGRGGVRIQGSIPVDCHVTLRVYDVLGRNIGTIFDGRHGVGDLSLSWTLPNGKAARPASGICFVRLEAVDTDGRALYRGTRKVLLLR